MKTNLWRDVPIILVIVGLLTSLFHPVFAGDGIVAPSSLCLSNVKQSSLGLLMYSSDENDRLPPRDFWMDVTHPYVKNESLWHCPLVPENVYGYAFNGALSSQKEAKIDDPVRTPALYDSVNPTRNASDLCASLPLPGRHGRKAEGPPGRNMVSYVDGHAKAVPGTPAR